MIDFFYRLSIGSFSREYDKLCGHARESRRICLVIRFRHVVTSKGFSNFEPRLSNTFVLCCVCEYMQFKGFPSDFQSKFLRCTVGCSRLGAATARSTLNELGRSNSKSFSLEHSGRLDRPCHKPRARANTTATYRMRIQTEDQD